MDNSIPAFPSRGVRSVDGFNWLVEPTAGMSLRDYFAAHAPGFVDGCSIDFALTTLGWPHPGKDEHMGRWWARADAAYRYMQADAMLAARAWKEAGK